MPNTPATVEHSNWVNPNAAFSNEPYGGYYVTQAQWDAGLGLNAGGDINDPAGNFKQFSDQSGKPRVLLGDQSIIGNQNPVEKGSNDFNDSYKSVWGIIDPATDKVYGWNSQLGLYNLTAGVNGPDVWRNPKNPNAPQPTAIFARSITPDSYREQRVGKPSFIKKLL